MSKQLAIAELIRLRILTTPGAGEIETPCDLTKIDVIVDRQKNLVAKVGAAVSKGSGTAIDIFWGGFVTLEKNATRPRLAHRFTLTVWSQPILSAGQFPADDVIEGIVNRLWHWIPEGGHCLGEAEVLNGGLVPDLKFLKYDCEITIPISH